MEGNEYKFRTKAQIVAVLDFIVAALSICVCLCWFVDLISLSLDLQIEPNDEKKNSTVLVTTRKPKGFNNNRTVTLDDFGIDPKRLVPDKGFVVRYLWLIFVILSIKTAFHTVAAIRLLNATKLDKEPADAKKLCSFWGHCALLFIVLLVFIFYPLFPKEDKGRKYFAWSFAIITILIRAFTMFIVRKFVNELDATIASTLPLQEPIQNSFEA